MARDPGGRYLQHREHRWPALSLELARWRSGPATEGVCDEDEHLLFVTLGGLTERTEARVEGGPGYTGADFPGAVSFIPAGRRREAWHGTGELDYATIRLPAADGVDYEPFTNQPDPLIRQLAVALRDEARGGWVAGPLFVDAVATTLSLHLVRRYSDRAPQRQSRTGALDGARLRAVTEHIAAHLDEDLRLDRLAGLAGMNRYQFIRSFKQATGLPPHQYVIERRIVRASELLAGTDLPIAEIASQVGMSSQSHLTTAFRRLVGDTPLAYRRSRRTA